MDNNLIYNASTLSSSSFTTFINANKSKLYDILTSIQEDESNFGVSKKRKDLYIYFIALLYSGVIPSINLQFNSSWTILDYCSVEEQTTIKSKLNLLGYNI